MTYHVFWGFRSDLLSADRRQSSGSGSGNTANSDVTWNIPLIKDSDTTKSQDSCPGLPSSVTLGRELLGMCAYRVFGSPN
jgi:hypothetical protein